MKVYEAVAKAIVDEQVGAIFALVGNANMELLTSVVAQGGPPIYHANIEGTALGMAEGFARSTGKLGFCSVTSGPALTNTTTALTNAVRAQTPLVLLTGHPADVENHQFIQQQPIASLTGAGYRDMSSAKSALEDVRAAFYQARSERRPVILDAGRAVQAEDHPWPYEYAPSFESLVAPQRIQPDPAALEEALSIIFSAERPVIIAGEGAIQAGAREALVGLAGDIGALLGTSLKAKNAFSGEPFNIGVCGLFSWKFTTELLTQSDCIIGFGASLNHYTSEGGLLFASARVVQFDIKPQIVTGSGKPADAYVRSDALAAAEAIQRAAHDRGMTGTRFRTLDVKEAIVTHYPNPDPAEFDIEPDLADPRKLCRVIDEAFPAESGIVVGTGHSWGFPNMELKKHRQPQLYGDYFGSIGISFPLAIGAAIGNPGRPFLLFDGDGSTIMNIHALNTIARYELPIFFTIMNDSTFGSEYHQFVPRGVDPALSILSEIDFAAVAAAFGCRSAVVRNELEMSNAVNEFLRAPGPFVVDARISRKVVSVATRRAHYGIET